MKPYHEICRMRILVIAATKKEIEPFNADNKKAEILITGIGVPATIYNLQKHLAKNSCDLVIQAGIAGAFNTNNKLGNVVVIKQDIFADIGMEEKENFTSIFHSDLMNGNEYPYTEGWLVNFNPLLFNSTLTVVNSVTVNKVSDSQLQKDELERYFAPQTESMEGAAFHYVCLQEKVPFLQLRSISNYVGERNKNNWKINEAITNLNEALNKLIKIAEK